MSQAFTNPVASLKFFGTMFTFPMKVMKGKKKLFVVIRSSLQHANFVKVLFLQVTSKVETARAELTLVQQVVEKPIQWPFLLASLLFVARNLKQVMALQQLS